VHLARVWNVLHPEVVTMRTARTKTIIRFRHLCSVAQKQKYGLSEHMCHKCHRTAAQCKAAVCTYIACSRPHRFCEYLHAQEGAMKTSATEVSAVQASRLAKLFAFWPSIKSTSDYLAKVYGRLFQRCKGYGSAKSHH